jgi:putative ABC transport system permease protein
LIIAAVIIGNQMNYLRSKDLGFAKDQQIIIPMRSQAAKNSYLSLRNELQKNPMIEGVGASMYYPGIFNPSDMPLYKEGENMNSSKKFFMNWVDEGFLSTLGIKPLAGRLFSKDFPTDTSFKMIVNLEGIKKMALGSPHQAVGKKLVIDWQGQTYRWEIIGVVQDFHFADLHSPIEPYGFQLNNQPQYNYAVAHAKKGNLAATLKSVEATWHQYNPNEPFEYSFLDDDFQKNYEADNRLAAIVKNFTIIAILISCLGLFGLASFSAERRTKEIGIRKVLGASVKSIVALLSKEFLFLVLIGVLIASPLAWWAMNKWLQDFAYRTTIQWWVFLVAAVIAILIALLTISGQALKAALTNPVKNLRTE